MKSLSLFWDFRLIMTIIFLIGFAVIKYTGDSGHIPTYKTFFVEKDPSLSYPYLADQVSTLMLYLISCLIPVGVLIICSVLIHFSFFAVVTSSVSKNSAFPLIYRDPTFGYFLNMALFGLNSFFVVGMIIDVLKNITGVLRPDFFAYCNYNGYNDAIISGNFTQYNSLSEFGKIGDFSKCFIPILDAQRSFPSGHAATSFVGMTITSIYIAYMSYYVFTNFCVVPSFLFLLISSWISLTRVQDYKHHTIDVVTGAFIGMLVPFLFLTSYHAKLKIFFQIPSEVQLIIFLVSMILFKFYLYKKLNFINDVTLFNMLLIKNLLNCKNVLQRCIFIF